MMKSKAGFTLVEVIIAIAAMAVLGGFIMQMFVLSQQIDQSATNTDKALRQAKDIVAEFKLADSPQSFWNTLSTEGYKQDGNSVNLFFDGDWNSCDSDKSEIIITVSLKPPADQSIIGCMDLQVLVLDVTNPGQMEELVNLQTARYFGVDEEAAS